MSSLWVLFIVIWAIVELIGLARKKDLRSRMKYGAIWSVIIVSFSTVGQMRQDQSALLQLAICLVLYGTAAIIIYFARLMLAKLFGSIKEKAAKHEVSP
jgi:hypothetical protein